MHFRAITILNKKDYCDKMDTGNIGIVNPKENSFPRVIREALEFLRKTDFSQMENKKYILSGEKMFVIVSEYETKPIDERKAECHRQYIDVQYLISGTEMIGAGSEAGNNRILTEYNPKIDALFYQSVENEKFMILNPGDYAIFFPGDIHRPGFSTGETSKVRKAVVKISINVI